MLHLLSVNGGPSSYLDTRVTYFVWYSIPVKVLVACEFSGVVTGAFRREGHAAYSCDILPTEGDPRFHLQGDVLDFIEGGWDLMIAHPPCTYLAASGARWWAGREQEQQEALEFVFALRDAPIRHIAIENPVGKLSTAWRKPDQYIQPWEFGHGETKKTGLWLKNLPLLEPTQIVDGREPIVHHMSPSRDRWKHRSRTYPGIALAMAEQWSYPDVVIDAA